MNEVFKKLNLKNQQTILVANSPISFEKNIKEVENSMNGETEVVVFRETTGIGKITFSLCFVQKEIEVKKHMDEIVGKLIADPLIWFAYPKKSSKKYSSEISRDHGWAILGQHDLEPVRLVAIDEDWSAMRFRKVDVIKTFSRDKKMALSEKGKNRKH